MKASDLLVKCLELEGVTRVFGVPGEENLDFLESLRNTTKIEFITTRHEQGAGFMAATFGRMTGKAGVCLATLGPGATNLVTAAAYAQLGGMPMIMITGQKPINRSKQGKFQIINVVEMMRPITKFSEQVAHGERIPEVVRNAFKQAQTERMGAALIELPEDVAGEETTYLPFPLRKTDRPGPHPDALNAALEMLYSAKRPLLLVGAGANRARISTHLLKFLQKTGLYFFNTQMGKGAVPIICENYLGTAALSAHDYVHCAVENADLILNLGHDIIEKPPFFMEPRLGPKVIHCNYYPAIVDEVYFPHLEVLGDIGVTLQAFNKKLNMKKANWDFSYFARSQPGILRKTMENSNANDFPVKPQRYVADIRKVMKKKDIITLDNGMYKLWFARNYRAYASNTILLDNALATMGAGLPAAMAAKMLAPKRKVMAICGDGGFMMNSQELETAVRLQLDLLVVVLNNSRYGMIRWKQEAAGFPDYGLDFNNPDFVLYAKSYGAFGHRVKKTEDFLPLMEKCFAAGGVHILDLPVDDSEHTKVLTKELGEMVCMI